MDPSNRVEPSRAPIHSASYFKALANLRAEYALRGAVLELNCDGTLLLTLWAGKWRSLARWSRKFETMAAAESFLRELKANE
jgi:hypothetical protein